MNDMTVRAMASAQEVPFLDVLQHQGLAVTICDVGLAPPADEGGVGQLGGAMHGGCNDYNGFWDLTWLLSGGGSKDSQLFRQQCCKVIYTSK